MVDGRLPVRPRQRLSLCVRDRHNRFISKSVEHRNQVWKVETSVQRSDMWNGQIATNRKMQVSSVKMNKIELINVLDDVIYQKDFPRHRVFAALILPQRALARRNEPRSCNGIAAGKQSHFVTCSNQFFCKIRNDSFGPSIMFWRHAFMKRCYLCNSHLMIPLFPNASFLLSQGTISVCKRPRAFFKETPTMNSFEMPVTVATFFMCSCELQKQHKNNQDCQKPKQIACNWNRTPEFSLLPHRDDVILSGVKNP